MKIHDSNYSLIIGGVIYLSAEVKLLEKVEIYVDKEWIPLITDVSATQYENLKIIVDGVNPKDIAVIEFKTFEELKKIKYIRITAMTIEDKVNRILHISRNTIKTEFIQSEEKEYGLVTKIYFPLLCKNSTYIVRALKQFNIFNNTLIVDGSKKDTIEIDEYQHTQHIAKYYVPYSQGMDILAKHYQEAPGILEHEKITKWNYIERYCEQVCHPLQKTQNGQKTIQLL